MSRAGHEGVICRYGAICNDSTLAVGSENGPIKLYF